MHHKVAHLARISERLAWYELYSKEIEEPEWVN